MPNPTYLLWFDAPVGLGRSVPGRRPGAEVPGRVACLEMLRRDGRCEGLELGAEVDAIDWTGFEAGVAALDALDLHGPQVVLVPVGIGEARRDGPLPDGCAGK